MILSSIFILPSLIVWHYLWRQIHVFIPNGVLFVQLADNDNLENKFKRLEGNDVDAELEQLKKGQLKGNTYSSSSSQQKLPEGRPIR